MLIRTDAGAYINTAQVFQYSYNRRTDDPYRGKIELCAYCPSLLANAVLAFYDTPEEAQSALDRLAIKIESPGTYGRYDMTTYDMTTQDWMDEPEERKL